MSRDDSDLLFTVQLLVKPLIANTDGTKEGKTFVFSQDLNESEGDRIEGSDIL